MSKGQIRSYVQIVENVLDRRLPSGAVVHHVDRNRDNDAHSNLVVLQNQTEHLLLHKRLRTKEAGGNPWTQQICSSCRFVKNFEEFSSHPVHLSGRQCECRSCNNKRSKKKYQERKVAHV